MTFTVKKILCFARPQVDTLVAIFLLRHYGDKHFVGIDSAELEFAMALPEGHTHQTLEQGGILALDLGGGRFDHHAAPGKTVSQLVAEHLSIHQERPLEKLLSWAKRDDLQGKGTVSADPLDRAFGLSGIITLLARQHQHEPHRVVELVLPLFRAHVAEETLRHEVLPQEWKRLKQAGEAGEFVSHGRQGNFRVAWVVSDNLQLPGFLRAYHQIDAVIQHLPSNHTNIITRQSRNLELGDIAAMLRAGELKKQGKEIPGGNWKDLQVAGRYPLVPEWFYDTAANTIQNGGVKPNGVPPTRLTLDEVKEIVDAGLQRTILAAYL